MRFNGTKGQGGKINAGEKERPKCMWKWGDGYFHLSLS